MPDLSALKFDPAREQRELEQYLGDQFDLGRLRTYQQTLDEEFAACGDEERFYRTSNGYLYNLTAFAMTGTKLPYLEQLMKVVPPGSRVLDYGCGIGSDGLLLLAAGYRVEFADFDNPSVEYLRWRLEHRGIDAPIHDLDKHVPDGFDASFAFDVIEHVPDAHAFLHEMESRSRVVVVNFLEEKEDDQDIHHELPIKDLVRRATRGRLHFYRVIHGGSHLVVYEPERPGYAEQLRGRARVASARLAHRLER